MDRKLRENIMNYEEIYELWIKSDKNILNT